MLDWIKADVIETLDFMRAHPLETGVVTMLFIITYAAVLALNMLGSIHTALEAIAASLKQARTELHDDLHDINSELSRATRRFFDQDED
jgi:hypothetical protein